MENVMEENWSSMYCVQLYEPTETDNGFRHLIKDGNTGKVYEEKVKIIKTKTINGNDETFEYYDRKPLS